MTRGQTDRILALLAASGAEVRTTFAAHDATWEIYDALPGDERGGDSTYWKTGTIGRFDWTCFRPREPRPGAAPVRHGDADA